MSRTVADCIRDATIELRKAGVCDPAKDARRLMAAALGEPLSRLTVRVQDVLPAAGQKKFARMIEARQSRQPVAQILGKREFWGREFVVTPEVLDPRAETETLIEVALLRDPPATILDLGTGSGAILVTLLCSWRQALGTATDISGAALDVARTNAGLHGVAERTTFVRSDWGDDVSTAFDLVVCNPPYVTQEEFAELEPDVRSWEPQIALCPGASGLESYRNIARDLDRLLAPEGRAIFEIGWQQSDAVSEIYRRAGFRVAGTWNDLAGLPRVLEIERA
jgi:release factor glutamine methyltransferase